MNFPLNPDVGDVFEAINGKYEYSDKLAWKRLPVEPSEASGLPVFVGSTPPVSPRLGDQWYNPDEDKLFSWATDGTTYYWQLFSGVTTVSSAITGAAAVDRLLPLTWTAGDHFAFEMWQDDVRYNWRDFNSVAVVGGTAGDDSLDLANTEGVLAGQSYAIVRPDGTLAFTVDVSSVVNGSRIRLRNNLGVTVNAAQNLRFARTSFEVIGGFAQVQHNDVFFSRWLTPLLDFVNGVIFLRRSAAGKGVFVVRAREFGATAWTALKLANIYAVSTDYRDEEYTVPFGGLVQLDIRYQNEEGSTERVFHMAMLPSKQGVDARRVDTPTNVSPADNGINVSTTPTLQGSTFRSIYNLAQNGAEFQIAVDDTFKNLVLNTSSDFLASWVSAASYPAPIKSLRYLETNAFVAASGTTVTILDNNSAIVRTATVGQAVRGVATDGVKILAAGVAGSLSVSTDKGATYTAYTAGGAYSGELRGCAIRGSFALAVGAGGEIQRSINGGVIWSKIAADNNYLAQFEAVGLNVSGYAVVVGANGEIQTSANNGATWTKRTAAGGYTGTWSDVSLSAEGYAVAVGANGEIQTSDDFGATWTKRTPANGFAGQFNAVRLLDLNALAVGAGGEIQTSKDRGVTWSRAVAANGYNGAWLAAALSPDNNALIGGEASGNPSAGATQRTLNLRASTTSYTVPAGSNFLDISKVYYWRVRYQDAAGFWSEYSKPTVFATAANINGVKAPTNIAPAPDALDVSQQPTLQTSLFAVTGAADTHTSTTYQVSTTEGMSNPKEFTSANAAELLSLVVPASADLKTGIKYYWRARHTGQNNGTSAWSAVTAFTVKATSNAGPAARELKVLEVRENSPPSSESAANKADYFYGQILVTDFYTTVANDLYSYTIFQASNDGVTWAAETSGFSTDPLTQVNEAYNAGFPSYRITAPGYRLTKKGQTIFLRFRHVSTVTGPGPWSTVLKYTAPTTSSFGEAVFTEAGTYTFTVPPGIGVISAVLVGGGSGQSVTGYTTSLGNIFSATGGVAATGGLGGAGGGPAGADGGGTGGRGGNDGGDNGYAGGGGGAGGYSGAGGAAGHGRGDPGQGGTGGGGGGGAGGGSSNRAGDGGGTGLYGEGTSGVGGTRSTDRTISGGKPGSGGSAASFGGGINGSNNQGGGGGGLAWKNNIPVAPGQQITVTVGGPNGGARIIWGAGRSFPNNAA